MIRATMATIANPTSKKSPAEGEKVATNRYASAAYEGANDVRDGHDFDPHLKLAPAISGFCGQNAYADSPALDRRPIHRKPWWRARHVSGHAWC